MSTLRNKVNLIGRLGITPEIRENNGHISTRFSLATNEPYRNKQGEWIDNTQWHNIIIWGVMAERFVRSAEKGMEVAIEGKLVHKQYLSKTGEKRYSTDVEVNDFFLLNMKKKNNL